MSIMDGVDSLSSRWGIYAVVSSSYVREVNGLNKPDAESFPSSMEVGTLIHEILGHTCGRIQRVYVIPRNSSLIHNCCRQCNPLAE
jgi:hypothetical protein